MKEQEVVNRGKLNKVLENPQFDNEKYQKVFAFVEGITGQKINFDGLTPEDVEAWNCKFGEVIEELFDGWME